MIEPQAFLREVVSVAFQGSALSQVSNLGVAYAGDVLAVITGQPSQRYLASAAELNGALQFSVRDYGPGVPRDQMKKIFKLFYRTGSELSRETVGTGIGLALVWQLTRAMGGRVDVVNMEPGASFNLSFPTVE